MLQPNVVMALCPAGGRSPAPLWCRRRKSLVSLFLLGVALLGMLQWVEEHRGFSLMRPLADARSEARRLLTFITHYHLQCNTTLPPSGAGNRSYPWPVCIDSTLHGLDLEAKGPRQQALIIG